VGWGGRAYLAYLHCERAGSCGLFLRRPEWVHAKVEGDDAPLREKGKHNHHLGRLREIWGGGGITLRVEFAERGNNYGILFRFSLFCEYIHLEYARVHVIYRVT